MAFFFLFQKSYWVGEDQTSTRSWAAEAEEQNDRHFEREPSGLAAGVRIVNLRKAGFCECCTLLRLVGWLVLDN